MQRARVPPRDLKIDVAHSARMYDHYLGGKDNFAADREAAEKVPANYPAMRTTALENRAFLRRAVTYPAADSVKCPRWETFTKSC
ncbi:SAM-dependent methyltransferase [Actinomadura scrupuli]|uniref:SAM-dependent methyltransferase n=1 Tax=Actinomadura scrupuli TaxID=559629 RepID=UPI003D9753B8